MKITNRLVCLLLCIILVLSTVGCSENPSSETTSMQKLPGTTRPNAERTEKDLVKTVYPTFDNIVADINVLTYNADPTGEKDSTDAFTVALNNCSALGGGTVWVPAGKYLIKSAITIPSYVTLRGDWQDPDTGNEYGTIIIADTRSKDSAEEGLFNLNASSGVCGLTVYYKNQSIDNVVPYPFTFYMNPGMLVSIRNCTIINGYRGIGTNAKGHEQLIIKNVKGTVLKTAIAINNSSDVGTIDTVVFDPKYWANAGANLKAADKGKIESYTKLNGFGLYITDAEQQQMYNISLTSYKYGLYFPSVQTRYMGSGSFYGLNIRNCQVGVFVAPGTHNNGRDTTVDYRWGYNIANSVIEGSQYSIFNDSTEVQGRSGCFKLSGVKLLGETHGHIISDSISTDLSQISLNTLRETKTTGTYFKSLDSKATEEDIQAALDEAGKAGGGVVYLLKGYYNISKGLKVPANVLLKGKCASPVRIAASGTVFVSEQKTYDSAKDAQNGQSLITLEGENAGVSGIFFHYTKNTEILKTGPDYKYYAYTVRGLAKNVYATNLCIVGATHGINFTGCENYVIEGVHTSTLENSFKVSGGGIVMNCLQNITVLVRCEYLFSHEEEQFNMFDITRYANELIKVQNSSNDIILNCFGYGIKSLVSSNNSNNLLCINIGADNIGDFTYMHSFKGGSAVVINSLRYNGFSVKNDGCNLRILNRMAIWNQYEEDI